MNIIHIIGGGSGRGEEWRGRREGKVVLVKVECLGYADDRLLCG